jgi:hypothetical protein
MSKIFIFPKQLMLLVEVASIVSPVHHRHNNKNSFYAIKTTYCMVFSIITSHSSQIVECSWSICLEIFTSTLFKNSSFTVWRSFFLITKNSNLLHYLHLRRTKQHSVRIIFKFKSISVG